MTTLAQGDLPADRQVLRTIAQHNSVHLGGGVHYPCVGVYASTHACEACSRFSPPTSGRSATVYPLTYRAGTPTARHNPINTCAKSWHTPVRIRITSSTVVATVVTLR